MLLQEEIKAREEVKRLEKELEQQRLHVEGLNVTEGRLPPSPSIHTPTVALTPAGALPGQEEVRRAFKHGVTDPDYLSIERRFPTVPERLFKDVFYSKLDMRNIVRFHSSSAALTATVNKDRDEKFEPARDIVALLMCLEVYCTVVAEFAHPDTRHELTLAMSQYRIRLAKLSFIKTFASIRLFHEEFVARIIRSGQDNHRNWTERNANADDMLEDLPKDKPRAKSSSSTSASGSRSDAPERLTTKNGACRLFNDGSRCEEGCQYKHVCIKCQQEGHGAKSCPIRGRNR